ncbi:MAG: hypothetical protein EHM43_10755, partial [Ignavibacteriae bacterium]
MNVMLLVVLLSLTAVHQPQTTSHQPQTTNHQPQTTDHELLAEVNAMRSDPASFIPAVDAYYREWQSFVKNKKGLKK